MPLTRSYRRLTLYSIVAVTTVAVIPLIVMTLINYSQYEKALREEQTRPISRLTSTAKHSLEFFLAERLSALSLIIREKSLDELSDQKRLKRVLHNMQRAFGGFVDLGLIDMDGFQVSYAGPHQLQGKNYKSQDWFHAVTGRGVYVSDVFTGFRKLPHFVIAVAHEKTDSASVVLRATIDTEKINRQILDPSVRPSNDLFLVNRQGFLQTPSRTYGGVLERIPFAVPLYSAHAEVIDIAGPDNRPSVLGYAYVAESPFVIMLVSRPGETDVGWLSLRNELVVILAISVLLILTVVVIGSTYMVRRVREADMRRAEVFHKMEYTNKMAVIGRLAAGVAHEVNNPLAIINEKAGLIKDLFSLADKPPSKERVLELVGSVLKSVERCSDITHRLLGFAKHMDVSRNTIDLGLLLKEVLSFLEKEAAYREINVQFHIPAGLPHIESDRSQLQQVFLNILNNAFAAVEDKGEINITGETVGDDKVAVKIEDNGIGIPEAHLRSVFEPFFTTKAEHGTGLGLSITYGIVEKLGGTITVSSKEGEGTCFTVVLPVMEK